MGVAEHHHLDDDLRRIHPAVLHRMGWCSLFNPASPDVDQGVANSSVVGIVEPLHIHLHPPIDPELQDRIYRFGPVLKSRLTGGMFRFRKLWVTILVIYLLSGDGLSDRNLELLKLILLVGQWVSEPFVDF